MADIYAFAYVEDEATKAVLNKILSFVNGKSDNRFCMQPGFPSITRGFGKLKKTAKSFVDTTRNGCWAIFITDLDNIDSIQSLCNEWFSLPCFRLLPPQMVFRVAVREVESWIMADVQGISEFFNIHESNFSDDPDSLPDPKQYLLNLIRRKCRKKVFQNMLPEDNQCIGIEYNPQLKKFINQNWDIERAMAKSTSLQRAVICLQNKLDNFTCDQHQRTP